MLSFKKARLDARYAHGRKTRKALIYRLWRRTRVVLDAMEEFGGSIGSVLDIGTADGRMLADIKTRYPQALCVGIEYSSELAEVAKNIRNIRIVRADAGCLPFEDLAFDAVVAAAVIEHLPDPRSLLTESFRVLKQGGLLIMTTPHPFWERTATFLKLLERDQHYTLMNIKKLNRFLAGAGFSVIKARRFMLSPVGLPLEERIESIFRALRINFLFANQLIVSKKAGRNR